MNLLDGTIRSGPSALVGLGCGTTKAGIEHSNSVASVNAAPLLTSGTVATTVSTSSTSSSLQSQATSDTQAVSLLGGAVTADAVQAVSTTTFDSTGFHTSASGSNLVNLVIGGTAITVAPSPNTRIPLAGFGFVVLNQQKVGKDGQSLHVNMIRVEITVANPLLPLGSKIIVGRAFSGLGAPAVAKLDGHAFGTRLNVGNLVTSGPSAVVRVGCTGKNPAVRTNVIAGVSVPGVLSTGTVTDTAQGSVTSTLAESETTSTVQAAQLLLTVLSASVIKADAHASFDGSQQILSDDGSSFSSLSVLGHPEISANVAPNTSVNLLGLGTLYLHRVIRGPHSIEVRMIELVLNTGPQAGTDLQVAVAEASVHP